MTTYFRDGSTKLCSGLYQIRGANAVARIRSNGNGQWTVVIHSNETMAVLRYAGVWATLRDAKEEAHAVLGQYGVAA